MRSKSVLGIFILGALLIAGLFFVSRTQNTEEKGPEAIESYSKPLDFRENNQGQLAADQKQFEGPAFVKLDEPRSLSPAEQKQWTLFQEILNSRNDNDARVDTELRDLTPEFKESLRSAYSQLPAENRNARGFAAFLIAREIRDVRDLQFLKEIFQESPCLSFQKCSQVGDPDPHLDGINETSLNYPQLVSLYQLQKQLEANPSLLQSSEMKTAFSETLREARQFPNSAIQAKARELQEKYGL